MSVTSGFFNSLNHDRRYDAQQFSALFDGIINDGVFANIGVAFAITADTGVTITIGKGRAWFNSAWIYNDALLPKTLEGSEVVLDRIDAVVIEVDHGEAVRLGDIKIVKGTPSSNPQRPAMANTASKHQHPLAYIYRKAGSTNISQADITNMVGTSECPYVTGILQVQNIDNIVAQWNAQWNRWYSEKISETDSDASELLAAMKSEFDIWFADVRAILDDDVTTAISAQVALLQSKFDDLARDGVVYDTLEDSNLDEILGSDGTPIEAKTAFSSEGGNSNSGSNSIEGPINMNGNRLTGLNVPTDEDEAANKKYVDNATAATNAHVNEQVKKARPRNLLDNSDFRHPVNQRGFVSGTSGNHNYTIDCWLLEYDTILHLHPGYIGISGFWTLGQYVGCKLLAGKTYTFAVEARREVGTGQMFMRFGHPDGTGATEHRQDINDNEWTKCTKVWTADRDYEPGEAWFAVGINTGHSLSTQIYYKNPALYEGEYTEETLPEYQPKGYENELLICRQYDPATGEYIGLRKFGSAHNLLDNSDFTNLVAQAGIMAKRGANVYLADRWKANVESITYDESTKVLSFPGNALAMITQVVKMPVSGKTFTFAIKASSVTGSINISESLTTSDHADILVQDGITVHTFTAPELFEVVLWSTNPCSLCIDWLALYEGEYTIDTLPEYQPKGYMVEALNCGALTVHENLTIPASGWSSAAPYTQTVSVAGISADDTPHVSPVYSETLATALAQKEAWGMVSRAKTAANAITFYCFEDRPTTNIPVQIEVNR